VPVAGVPASCGKRDLYTEGGYFQEHPTWHLEDSPWKAQQILRMLERHPIPLGTVCEAGCGAGGVLRALHDNLAAEVSFVGFDISPQALALAEERNTDRLRFELRDVLAEAVSETFDLMLVIDVIEHVEDYFGFLRALRTRARHTIFHIPLDLSAQSVLRRTKLLAGRRQLGHIHNFTKDIALEALHDVGYQVVDCFYTPSAVGGRASSWKSRLAEIPREVLFRLNEDFAARSLGGFSLLVLAK
jgi:SAM-dependent methyltransferase